MIPLFPQKHTKEDNMLTFFLLEKKEMMLIGSFRLDYEYEIEYEYDFRISNQ